MAGEVQPESHSERRTSGPFADGVCVLGRAVSGVPAEVQNRVVCNSRAGVAGKGRMGEYCAKARVGTVQTRPHASQRIEFRIDDHCSFGLFVPEKNQGSGVEGRRGCRLSELAAEFRTWRQWPV